MITFTRKKIFFLLPVSNTFSSKHVCKSRATLLNGNGFSANRKGFAMEHKGFFALFINNKHDKHHGII